MRILKTVGSKYGGRSVVVDDDVYERIKDYPIYLLKGEYPRVGTRGNGSDSFIPLLLHRLIMGATDGEIVDHISGNTLDNRRCNLRFCTASQNKLNSPKRKNTASKYKGVTWYKNEGKWSARASIGEIARGNTRKLVHLGMFNTEVEAHEAFVLATKQAYGEFANYKTQHARENPSKK